MRHVFLLIPMLAAALAFGGSPLLGRAEHDGKHATTIYGSPARKVHEEQFVSIGGIEQWVTIKGESSANPVILFLHGGPGNTLSPYADPIYGSWEKEFTLVQWDQRGAGRTYGRNVPTVESALAPPRMSDDPVQAAKYLAQHPLTIERMTEDGVQLAEYLAQHLAKKKIILMGGSWGSILGVHMVKSRPDLFYAYVGIAQIVNESGENGAASYAKVIALARAAGDQATVSRLEVLGAPPWVNPRNFGILRLATRVYEAKSSTPAPESWWVRSPDYDTPQMRTDYSEGEDYSFLQFVGLKGDGMSSKVDLPKLGRVFKVPVFLIQGSEDLVAVPEVAKRYFDSIKAPHKEYVLVPKTGHDPNVAMIDAEYKVMRERVLPLTK